MAGGGGYGAAAGAGLGLIQANQDKAKYNQQKQLAADIQRNSTWTGVQGKMPDAPAGPLGQALQGAMGGAQLGSSIGAMGGGASSPMAGASQMAPMAGGPSDAGQAPGFYNGKAPGKSSWAIG